MGTITLKDIPARLHRALKVQARASHRSLNREILDLLAKAVLPAARTGASAGWTAGAVREPAVSYAVRGAAPAGRDERLARITSDPRVCFGKPCIRGTRIWVSLLLDLMADGLSVSDLLREYPQLAAEDIQAALAYGAAVSRERILDIPA
jgi:uncharacterized protein (DUF433 family)/plasmid stability protein